MILTFKEGAFKLLNFVDETKAKLLHSGHWILEKKKNYQLSTDFIGAALDFKAYSDNEAENIFNRILIQEYQAPNLVLPSFLDDHQKEGVLHILTRSKSYLAHDPGTGKTTTFIVAAHLCEDDEGDQALVIVPPHLTKNWEREILSKKPGREFPTVAVVPPTTTYMSKRDMDWTADFLICPDSMHTKEWVLNNLLRRKFKIIGIDEAHRFKEPFAQRSLALYGGQSGSKIYPGFIHEARHTVMLSGSPMPNRPMELWAPCFALAPESIDFMDQVSFGYRYCAPKHNEWGKVEFKGESNGEELHEKLEKKLFHFVSDEVLNLPEKRREIVFTNTDPRSKEMRTWERRHLSQTTFDDIDEDMNQGDIAKYRRELGLGKVPWVYEFVGDLLENANQSILLFCWHRDVAESLAEKFKSFNPGVVIGGTSVQMKNFYFDSFQNQKRKLLIGNIEAMGEGVNLQSTGRNIFAEYSWSDEKNKQCEARAMRRGRKKNLLSQYIVVPNSLDEIMLNSVFNKSRSRKRVIG